MIAGDERGMMKEAFSRITDALLGNDASTNLELYREDHPEIPDILSNVMTRPFFPGRKAVGLLDWEINKISETEQKRFCGELEAGIPEDNYILILSESLSDRRKFFYNWAKKNAELLDFRKETKPEKSDLPPVVKKFFAEKGFSVASDAVMELLSRCDFDYAKTMIEADKIMLCLMDTKNTIVKKDVQSMVVSTNEMLIFDFLDAVSGKDVAVSLALLKRMLVNGEEHVKIVFLLSRRIHSFIQFFDFLKTMGIGKINRAMRYDEFKNNISPVLNDFCAKYSAQRTSLITGHPYYIYKLMLSALSFSSDSSRRAIEILSYVDRELKTSALSKDLIVENMVFSFVSL